MKNLISFPDFKSAFFLLVFALLMTSFCRAQNIWAGGTPGDETNWDNPRNWSENRVPDWTHSEVLIPNTESASGYFPVIKNEVEEINFLNIQSGAEVYIEKTGVLTIDGAMTANYGILNIGELNNFGKLIVKNAALSSFFYPERFNRNTGIVNTEAKTVEPETLTAEIDNQPSEEQKKQSRNTKETQQFWSCLMNFDTWNSLNQAIAKL